MASLAGGCVPGSSYLLSEMSQVIPGESWGLGEAGSQAFKGGWGPGTNGGYLVRQMGTLPARGGTAVVAIAALPNDGQFSSGDGNPRPSRPVGTYPSEATAREWMLKTRLVQGARWRLGKGVGVCGGRSTRLFFLPATQSASGEKERPLGMDCCDGKPRREFGQNLNFSTRRAFGGFSA